MQLSLEMPICHIFRVRKPNRQFFRFKFRATFYFFQMYRCIRILNDSLRSLSRILLHFFFKKQVQNNFTRETTGTFFANRCCIFAEEATSSRKENSLKFLCIFPPKTEAHRLTSVKKSSLLMLKTTAFHSLDIVTIYTKVCFHCESRTFQKDIYAISC